MSTFEQAGVTYNNIGFDYEQSNEDDNILVLPVTYPLTEYWEVNGTPLQSYAYNIVSWGDSRQAPPTFNGSDQIVPHRAGALWQQKSVASRVITLGMWVIGASTSGIPGYGVQSSLAPDPGELTSRVQFETNWRTLRRLLWNPSQQITLSKTFFDDVSGKIVSAQALAEFSGGLAPSMNGTTRASFTVDLTLADPYFYSLEAQVGGGSFIPMGDAPTTKITLELSAGQTITNNTNGVWVKNAGSSGTMLDVYNFTSSNGLGNIAHGGAYEWMRIDPEPTTLSGSVTYIPAWL